MVFFFCHKRSSICSHIGDNFDRGKWYFLQSSLTELNTFSLVVVSHNDTVFNTYSKVFTFTSRNRASTAN